MLNNQTLKKKHIDYVPYELQVSLFDAKCKGCPYRAYRTKKITGLVLTFRDYREAIRYAIDHRAPLNRLCIFNGEEFTLSEIIYNHCVFWDNLSFNSEEDSEVTEITEGEIAQLKYKLYKLENFVKFKE